VALLKVEPGEGQRLPEGGPLVTVVGPTSQNLGQS